MGRTTHPYALEEGVSRERLDRRCREVYGAFLDHLRTVATVAPFPGGDGGVVNGEDVSFGVSPEVSGNDWTERGTLTGRVTLTAGRWKGERVSYRERKDGTHNFAGAAARVVRIAEHHKRVGDAYAAQEAAAKNLGDALAALVASLGFTKERMGDDPPRVSTYRDLGGDLVYTVTILGLTEGQATELAEFLHAMRWFRPEPKEE
jgi:hypothetical protein